MSDKNKPIVQKIEFDQTTNEPITVQLDEEQIPVMVEEEQKVELGEEFDIKNSSAKQMVMSNFLGFETKDNVDKRQKFFKNLFAILFAVSVVAVLVFTAINDFGSGDPLPTFEEIFSTLGQNWYFLVFAILALLGFYLFKALKLSIMCKSLTGKWHLKTCFETAIVGIYYNNVTPLAVGGQPFEIYHLSKHGVHGGVASSLPIATYFLNQIAFVVIGLTCVILYSTNALHIPDLMVGVMPKIVNVAAIIGLSFSLIMPVIIILFSLMPRFTSKLVAFVLFLGNKLHIIKNPKQTAMKVYKNIIQNSRCLKKFASKPLAFISSFLVSFLEHFSGCSIAFFVLKFFGFDWGGGFNDWMQITQLVVIINIAISFIPTPGNAGAADLSFYLLFKTGLGISNGGVQYGGYAFPAMITWRILCYYSTVIIGFIFTNLKKNADKKKAKKEEQKQQ